MAATSNLMLAWDAVIEECTLSGGAWSTGLPLSYLLTRQLDQKARSVNADSRGTRIYITAPSSITVAVAALLGGNFSSAAQWRLRGFAADPKPTVEGAFVVPALPASFSFSRGSVGRNFDSTGANVSTASGTHRINYDRTTHRARGVLIEGSTTNYILQCRNSTGWTLTNGTLGTAVGIDGVAASCMLLTATSANCTLVRSASLAGAVGGAYVLSFWVWGVTLTGSIKLTIDNFATETTVTAAVGAWTRVSVSGTYVSGNVGIKLTASGDSIRVDFGQFEPNGTAAPTSEILTTTTTVVRNNDSLSIADVSAAGLTQASMTMALRFRLTRLPEPGGSNVLGLSGGGTHFIGIQMDTGGLIHAQVINAGVTQASIAGPTMAVGDYLTVAMTWATNNVRVSFNGGAVSADTSATIPPSVALSATGNNGVALELERLQLFNGQLSDADLVAIAGGGEDMCQVAADDSGLVDAWPAAYLASTTSRRRARAKTPAFHKPATPYTRQWFRLDITDEANSAGFAEFGYLGLFWSAFQPEHNVEVGVGVGFRSRSSSVETDSGAEYDEIRPNPRELAFSFPALSDEEAWNEVFELLQTEGDTGMVLASLNPTDTKNTPRQTFIAKLIQLPKLAAIARGLWGAAFIAKERL